MKREAPGTRVYQGRASRIAAALALAVSVASPPRADEPEAGGAGAPLEEELVVTPTRGSRPLRDAAAAVTVIPRAEIERSPSKTTDELLRSVPSFGLFRQSSSVVADPSSQGVNLRGIGPSGVSRSLVLVDGVPANDPFGGWVYWRAMPRIGLQRIEVVPGGGSALYGNYALGGVTQLFSRPIAGRAVEGTAEYQSYETYQLGLRAADRSGPVGAAVEGGLLKSSGYEVVAPGSRGPIDHATPSWDGTVNARVEAAATRDLTLTLRSGYFYEDENGGTRFTTAAVRRFEYSAGARYAPRALGTFDLTVFGHANDFKQDRARVVTVDGQARADEFLAGRQDVPTHDLGVGLLWTSPPVSLAGTHTFTLGSEVRRITGATGEDLFPPGPTATTVVRRDAQGLQRLYGGFVQDVYDLSHAISLDVAVRYDRWENADASRRDRLAGGDVRFLSFAARSDQQVSPKLGLNVRPADWLTLRAEGYRSFRAPTLNELYRPFQVGTVLTNANENLGPEKLTGAEAGVTLAMPRGLTARVTGFWNQLDDPITNVTCSSAAVCPNVTLPASGTVRQRQNLGRARVRGVEAGAGWRIARAWQAAVSYTYAYAKVTTAPAQPQLVGRDLPLDPRHRASASLAFDEPRLLTALAQVRYAGRQYEDDLNTLPIGEFAVVDLFLSRRLTRQVEVLLAVENLLDKRYVVGRAGVDTIGQPRYVHGGVRVRLGE